MNRVKRFSAFTLMEMTTVMLIMSIVLAAAAPMMTSRMRGAGDASGPNASPWHYAENGVDAYFGSSVTQKAMIGQTRLNTGDNGRLIVNISDDVPNHIILNKKNNYLGRLGMSDSNGLYLGDVSVSGGTNSIAIGTNGTAVASDSVAIGAGVTDVEGSNVAIGSGASARGKNVVIGQGASAGGNNVVIGFAAKDDYGNGVVIGAGAWGVGETVAIGKDAKAKTGAIAIGNDAKATESACSNAIAIGKSARANAMWSISLGEQALSEYTSDVTIGWHATNEGENTVAIGSQVQTVGRYGIAIGTGAKLLGEVVDNQIAIGRQAQANGNNAVAIGPYAQATENTIVLGREGTAAPKVIINGDLEVRGAFTLPEGSNLELGNGASIVLNSGSYIYDKNGNALSQPNGATNGNGWHAFESDRRLKNVGTENKAGLEKIKELKIFNYTYKKDEQKVPHVGVIAQDLQKVFPNAVTKNNEGFLTVRMEDMFFAVVNAVKELDNKLTTFMEQVKKENTQLKQDVKQLKTENAELKARLDKLEAKMK